MCLLSMWPTQQMNISCVCLFYDTCIKYLPSILIDVWNLILVNHRNLSRDLREVYMQIKDLHISTILATKHTDYRLKLVKDATIIEILLAYFGGVFLLPRIFICGKLRVSREVYVWSNRVRTDCPFKLNQIQLVNTRLFSALDFVD